jgi:hypothetical protein
MECLRHHVDWNTWVRAIILSGDRLQKVVIGEGYGCVYPSAQSGADSHDQLRSRPQLIDVRRAFVGESGKNSLVLVTQAHADGGSVRRSNVTQ